MSNQMKKVQVLLAPGAPKLRDVEVLSETGSLPYVLVCAEEMGYKTGEISQITDRGDCACIYLTPLESGNTTLRPARIISFDDDDGVKYGIEPLGE